MPTVIVAIVSIFFALIGVMITRENKVSEFRQKGIDELREEINLFVAHSTIVLIISSDMAYVLFEKVSDEKPETKEVYRREKNKELNEHYLTTTKTATSIRLRVNDTKLLSQLDKLQNSFTSLVTYIYQQDTTILRQEMQKVALELNEFIAMSKIFLESEWKKVEEGEKVFSSTTKWIKYLLGFAVVIVVFSELPIRKIICIYDALSQPEVTVCVNPPPETKPESINTK